MAAQHDGQPDFAIQHIPQTRNNAVHHEMFQKVHVPKSTKRNRTPKITKIYPEILQHFEHIIA